MQVRELFSISPIFSIVDEILFVDPVVDPVDPLLTLPTIMGM